MVVGSIGIFIYIYTFCEKAVALVHMRGHVHHMPYAGHGIFKHIRAVQGKFRVFGSFCEMYIIMKRRRMKRILFQNPFT